MLNMFRVALSVGILISLVSAQIIHYSENFEGTTNWTVNSGWEFGSPTVSRLLPLADGTRCAGTILNGNYANYASYILTSPIITIPDSSVVNLSFYEWYSIETCCDHMYVEAYSNGTWSEVPALNSSSSSNWAKRVFNLSAYRNSSIQIRFRFTSDVSQVDLGWYVDQIRIFTPVMNTLTIQTSGNGSTIPAVGDTQIEQGVATSITATPSSGNRFNNWTVQNGLASIASQTSQSTNVTISDNATIQANFIPGTLYPITSTATTYDFSTHFFDVTPGNGVRFSFTAPSAGNYSIVVANTVAAGKYIYYYGTNSSFSSYVNYQSSTGTLIYNISATATNETHYFTVVPSSSSYYTSSFNINYANAYTLNLATVGNGTTSPTSPVILAPGQSQSISASAGTGYRFKSWTVQSGNASVLDTNAASTSVTISGNATIRANFIAGTVYPISSSAASYNFTTHYFDVSPSNGVRFSFTAPSAGNYSIVVANSVAAGKYIYYYGTNSSFSSYVNYQSSTGTLLYNISATAPNETHYFTVVPSSSSYYTSSFNINYANAYTLSVTSDGNGTISPATSVTLGPGQLQNISASAGTGYRFKNWTVQNGNASIADTNATSTSVTISGNATIRANFIAGTVYPVSSSAVSYNFTTHYFDQSPSNGVRFSFTAPAAGNYSILVANAVTAGKYIYYYGTSPSFASYVNYQSGTGTLTYNFNATAPNEIHYFRVAPTSSSYYTSSFNINYANAYALNIITVGNGTTSPTSPVILAPGQSQNISASPGTGYRFKNWTVQSGNASILDTNAASTSVSISGNATIRANFIAGTIYTASSVPVTHNFTTHYYQIDPSYGIWYKFTAPAAGSYTIVIDSSYKRLYYYGTDQTFSTYSYTTYSSSRITYVITAANTGENLYFRVCPYSSSYYTNNVQVSVIPNFTLTLSSNGNGSVTPSSPTSIGENFPVTITATPSAGSRFNKWNVVNGNATISDSNALSTSVTIKSNSTVQANFIPGTVYSLTAIPLVYNFNQHYYQISPSQGIRFSFSAPSAGTHIVVVDSSYKVLRYFGTDSTFATTTYTSSYSSAQIIYSITAAQAGERHFFDVLPYSSSYYNSNIIISCSSPLTLNVTNDGRGTTIPANAVSLASGQSQQIDATPSSGFRFLNWSVVSGNASFAFADPTRQSTTVQIRSNATIQANFGSGTIHNITNTPAVFNFNTHHFISSPSNGIRFRYNVTAAGPYAIIIDSTYSNLVYYGNDSTFTSSAGSVSSTSPRIIYSFTAAAGNQKHYFLVRPANTSYYYSDLKAWISTSAKLKITTDGRGITVPSTSVITCWKGLDTTITAIPKGGYQFSSWSVIGGNVQFSSVDSAKTRVKVLSDSAVIRANFRINSETRPEISISDINISSHPDICLTALVTDTTGRSIPGLDSTYFTLMQDDANVDYQLTQVSEITGVSVALVVDRSGSMTSTMINDAKNAALQYVRTMGPLDRSAIISFHTTAQVHQTITSDTTRLISAINGIVVADNTAILDGTLLGLQQLSNETNTRALIVFSDGLDNSSTVSQASVINYARQNHITIYSIGIGSSADRTVLGALADSTGGYFTAAPSAADLARIYAQIKSDIEAKYILCYRSPDQIFNGDTHQVVLSVNLNNKIDKDTVYWNENNQPPQIVLTAATQAMIGNNQTSNQPLTISANVTDDGTIRSVRLFFRTSSNTVGAYTEVPMQLISGTVYQVIIPAANVKYPGIDFYILATDNYQLIGRSPNILAPETQPWVIPVNNRIPVISNLQTTCLTSGVNNTITAEIHDSDGVFFAVLYYKKRTETFFTIDTMIKVMPDQYTGTIPSNMITSGGVDYYIRAVDDVGAAARYPSLGNDSLFLCGNTNRPPVANAGPDLNVNLTSGCNMSVNFNGSASNDPDGDPITFIWTGPFSGTLTGAKPSVNLPIGLHTVVLKVTDNSGLFDMDTVLIRVIDKSNPVPLVNTLPVQRAECSFTATPPKALDNCVDTITGVASGPTTFNAEGSYTIQWTYTDLNGNSISQSQQVVINDTTKPVPVNANLDILRGECSVILSAPHAIDNCKGEILATTSSPLIISDSGAHQILWTFNDGNGNSINQTQMVIIRDTTPPVVTAPSDTLVFIKAATTSIQISTGPASANDNCSSVSVRAIRSDGLPLDSAYKKDTTVITWIGTDKSGNSDTAKQNVIVKINRVPVLLMPADTFMSEREILNFTFHASDSDGTVPSISVLSAPAWLTVTNDKDSVLSIRVLPGCADHGNQEIIVIATDNVDTIQKVLKIRIDDVNFPPVFDSTSFEKRIQEGIPYELSIGVQDCDGTIPVIRMLTNVQGATFVDNQNNTGTFRWTPDADDNGYYMCIFEATDNYNKPVRDTIIIEVIDKNIYSPVLTVSTMDTTCSVNLHLVIIAHATDLDGTPPQLKATQIPGDATFTSDINGNGVFSWTPRDTGTFSFLITAYDQIDSTIKDTKALTVRVNNDNIAGPKFDPHEAITMYQNEMLYLNLRAVDPDGTKPILRLISAPQGSHFVDNGNGTAAITWSPACDASGTFIFKSTASDGKYCDTISVPVVVRDVNCTPVLFSTGDINAQPGERISIPIRSYDPDNNGSTPVLSVSCLLPDYSFITQNDGSAIFNWTVCYSSGTFAVVFYATDGNSTDSAKVMISINKKGSLKISATPSNSRIYAFPSDCFPGKLLGKDSVVYTGTPGTCWFEFQAPGCRSQRQAYNIKSDTTISVSLNLKPVIPLMVLSPDTIKYGNSNQILQNGSISFADLNKDHIIDLSIATASGIFCYYGIDSTNNSLFSSVPVTCYSGTLEPSVHHTFVYWNNNDNLNCILATKTGKILRINLKTAAVDTLISISGSRLYPTIFDADKDGKKDIIVNNAGKGLFIYTNTGTDSLPAISFARECTAPSGSPLTDLNGAALLLDTDMDGKEEVLLLSTRILKLFKPDSLFSTLTYIENLSCGGKSIAADSIYSAFSGSTTGISRFAVRTGNYILLYPTHLQGDVTSDGKVDIRDVSRASRNWEITSDDQFWDPSINVKISETGIEKIDIRDISRISKNWELQE